MASESPYSKLTRLEEEISQLEQKISDEKKRLEAIRLLHNVLNQKRDEAVRSVVSPVETMATQLLNRIAGPQLSKIHLAEGFDPKQITPQIDDTQVGLASLSGGEKEQIHFSVRLALAETLTRQERQMAVFDDILTATDTGRMMRILKILEEASQKLQIIILTCHPERYKGMSCAEFWDLEELKQAAP